MTQREFNDFLIASLSEPRVANAIIKLIAGKKALTRRPPRPPLPQPVNAGRQP
jgi:hypothetical protein